MGTLSIGDLLSFAKAGYSPKDVKELLSMEVAETKKSEVDAQVPATQEPVSAEPAQEQKTEGSALQNASTVTPESEPAEVIDYKARCDELEEKMKKLQEQNTRQNMAGIKTADPFEGIDNFLKSIM